MGIMSIAGLGEFTGDALDILASLIFPAVWADGKGQVCHIDRDRRCQYIINRETGEEIVIKGRETPLPGLLAGLAPSDRSRHRLWNLRHLLKEDWTVLFLMRGVFSEAFHPRASDFVGFAFAGAVAMAYHWTGWDALSNLLSIAMCYASFLMISPTSFSIGTLVLASLFVYDIVMVFYTYVSPCQSASRSNGRF
jgi:minor histocompatibility antigen H13